MSYGFRIKHTSHMNQFYNTLCLKLDGSCIHSIEKRSKNIVHTILCSLQTGTEQTFHWNKIKAYLWVNKRYACKMKPSSIASHLICSLKCWINILTPALKFLVFCLGCKSSFSSNNLAPPTRSECLHNFFYLEPFLKKHGKHITSHYIQPNRIISTEQKQCLVSQELKICASPLAL